MLWSRMLRGSVSYFGPCLPIADRPTTWPRRWPLRANEGSRGSTFITTASVDCVLWTGFISQSPLTDPHQSILTPCDSLRRRVGVIPLRGRFSLLLSTRLVSLPRSIGVHLD